MGIFYSKPIFNYDAILFMKISEIPLYLIKIEINELTKNELPIIKTQLLKKKNFIITKYIEDIIQVLEYILENNNEHIISQIDYYLFNKAELPLLEIKNKNAKINQIKHNTITEKLFVYDVNINKLWTFNHYYL